MNTTSWTCDTCGQSIKSPEDGWVEWINFAAKHQRQSRDLRLVHHRPVSPLKDREHGCQFDGAAEFEKDHGLVADRSLEAFLGANGLMNLLELIATRRLPTDEVLEMIKRLHIPGYERARPHFEEAIGRGVFEPNSAPGYYSQGDIMAVWQWLDSEE